MVLGTVQFGMDYGIANLRGKPARKDVFGILSLAWENGLRCFDTAPGYGSEKILGEFIRANGIQNAAKVLTKIPSQKRSSDFRKSILKSVEDSLNDLGCPISVLFFHDSADSSLMLEHPVFFETISSEFPVNALGVSVYEPQDVESISGCRFELAFQFPFNVLDRRFENVDMARDKRYARSIFLQGLLASKNSLRPDAPRPLMAIQKEYHDILAGHKLNPVQVAVSFVALNDTADYFLFGVDTKSQLQELLDIEPYRAECMSLVDSIRIKGAEEWLDPRNWFSRTGGNGN
jgi:aryl-alcohol dehydrogenase-like predicted oxidoreductase